MANTAGSVENFSAGEAQDEAGDGGIRAWCVHVGDRDGEGRFAASSNSACALLDLRPPSLWVMSLPSLSPSCAVGVGVTPCPIFSAE
ncbi:uncharacterized protein [Physcomitrium patens]|nr:uncharacterized protein LOC112285900 isoform X2 [Physcomitrium patens]|eukprot:XP_024383032.1 uncharacterized protein LOC112285900 isoform X2 [Physcomitrella patens]